MGHFGVRTLWNPGATRAVSIATVHTTRGGRPKSPSRRSVRVLRSADAVGVCLEAAIGPFVRSVGQLVDRGVVWLLGWLVGCSRGILLVVLRLQTPTLSPLQRSRPCTAHPQPGHLLPRHQASRSRVHARAGCVRERARVRSLLLQRRPTVRNLPTPRGARLLHQVGEGHARCHAASS